MCSEAVAISVLGVDTPRARRVRPLLRWVSRAWPWALVLCAVLLLAPAWLVAGFVPMSVLALGLPLILFRRRPLVALVLVLLVLPVLVATAGASRYGVLLIGILAVWAATVRLAVHRRWTLSLPWTVVAALEVLAVVFAFRPGIFLLARDVPLVLLFTLSSWLIANSVGESRRRAVRARARETERAIEAERLRIAREMHDLIAHSLGVIAIQAGMGSRVIETQPAEARTALSAIESTSRQTLAELRRTLTALRRSDPEGAPAAPAPGLTDLGRLVRTARDAGVTVEVERLGQARPLPADLELTAYRIVQESVTNVVRHAGAPRCLVRLDFGATELTVEVMDDGRGTSEATGSGYGLVGMRERTSLLGGRFSAGPQAEGGFRVLARLPVPVDALSR
jgi:signal transduction histidine kinase